MPSLDESFDATTELGAGLQAGVTTLSLDQEIEFDLYVRLILPMDGFVFWVKASELSNSAVFNAMAFNAFAFNSPGQVSIDQTTQTFIAGGSLHYLSDSHQDEEANYTVNRVVFTSKQEVQQFNLIGPNTILIGKIDEIRFAFSSRGSFYRQANLWHYVGNAVYSTMDSQIIDDRKTFNSKQLVVSNSLPAWLALNHYAPPYPVPMPQPAFPLYPSYLVPENLPPPYGVIHIGEDSTTTPQAAAFLSNNLSHYQLAKDVVKVTLYGVNNDCAQSFLDSVVQYSLDVGAFGVTNMPIVRDDKQTQNELDILAMKKRINFEVSYLQTSMRNVARQLILKCVPDVIPESNFIVNAPINVL